MRLTEKLGRLGIELRGTVRDSEYAIEGNGAVSGQRRFGQILGAQAFYRISRDRFYLQFAAPPIQVPPSGPRGAIVYRSFVRLSSWSNGSARR
jgi:hypothetical protein